jgi:hypothetical protein
MRHDAMRRVGLTKTMGHPRQPQLQVDVVELELDAAGIQARRIQQVVDQAEHQR